MDLIILALATWRISSLIANERGPYDIFGWLRYKCGVREGAGVNDVFCTRELARMVVCVWCNSIWVGLAMTVVYALDERIVIAALPLALSAAAIVAERFINGTS